MSRLDRWLFAPCDPRMAALFRMALAAMVAYAFWPRGLAPAGWPVAWLDLTRLYDHVFLTPAWWGVAVAFLVLFGLGVRPRPAGMLLAAALLPLAFLESGRRSRQVLLVVLGCFSLVRSDAALALRARGGGAGPLWPIQLVRLQLSAVYAVNALMKTMPHYLSGEALHGMAARLPNFVGTVAEGRLVLGPLAVPLPLAAALSAAAEWALAVAFWFPRLRLATAALGVGFHLLLQQVLRIFMLDTVCMFLYLAFLLPFSDGRPRAAWPVARRFQGERQEPLD
jgi:hypothetical protein